VSVINDMLRDLDQRHAPESGNGLSDTEKSTLESMIEPAKKWSAYPWIILAISIVILAFGALYFGTNYLGTNNLSNEHPHSMDRQGLSVPILPATEIIQKNRATQDNVLKTVVNKLETTQVDSPKTSVAITQPKAVVKESIPKSLVDAIKVDNNEINHKDAGNNLGNIKVSLKDSLNGVSLQNTVPKVTSTKPHIVESTPSILKQNLNTKMVQAKRIKSKRMAPKINEAKVIAVNAVKVQAKLSPQEQDKKVAMSALKLFQNGESREAYRVLYNFISAHKVDIKSRIILASQLLNDQRTNEAGDVIMNSSTGADPDFRQMKARWLVTKGENKLAIVTLQTNLPEITEYPDYYALLASYYQKFGYPKLALKTYSDLVQFDENKADWWAGFAIAADQSLQPLQAELAYKRAIQLPNLSPGLVGFVKRRIENFNATLN